MPISPALPASYPWGSPSKTYDWICDDTTHQQPDGDRLVRPRLPVSDSRPAHRRRPPGAAALHRLSGFPAGGVQSAAPEVHPRRRERGDRRPASGAGLAERWMGHESSYPVTTLSALEAVRAAKDPAVGGLRRSGAGRPDLTRTSKQQNRAPRRPPMNVQLTD